MISTLENPYKYDGSGLPNVFLVNVTHSNSSVDIPQIKDLFKSIADRLVMKSSALIGCEVRFLRKRLGKKGIDFSKAIGITPESLSRIECDYLPLKDLGRDRLVRLLYLCTVTSNVDPFIVFSADFSFIILEYGENGWQHCHFEKNIMLTIDRIFAS